MNDIEVEAYVDALKPTLCGYLLYYCLPFRKRVVLANMRHVFGGKLSEKKIRKLAKSFYSHIGASIKENVLMRFMSEEKIKSRGVVEGVEHVLSAAGNDKGVLILTGHFGNWEFAPIAGILNFKAYQGRLYFIRKTLGHKFIEKILFRRYYQAGLNVIPKKNSLSQVCDVLERNNAVVFVMDQHACVQSRDGIAVEFFGKQAGTYRSLATIARNTELAVVPAATFRHPSGKHILKFFPPIDWQPHESTKQALIENTRRYNQVLETLVLAHPEQWLWMHKRWKL